MTDEERLSLLEAHFNKLSLPEKASNFLLILFRIIQIFDDFADSEKVSDKKLDILIWDTLVRLPTNSFYRAHDLVLAPLIITSILKWKASDTKEKELKSADAKSFMWRAGYYEIVLFVVSIVHGEKFAQENAVSILELYGETFDNYLEEFNNA